jgi:hypothetical protein
MSSESDTPAQALDCVIYYCILGQAHCGGQLKYCHVISQYSFIHLAATYLAERSPVFAFKRPGCLEPRYSGGLLLLMMMMMMMMMMAMVMMMITMMFIVYTTALLKLRISSTE